MALRKFKVVSFADQHAAAFAELNREWIEKYFVLEEEDLKVLNDPRGYVINSGGEIFFALDADNPAAPAIGTVAMVKTADRTFELAKMAVSPHYQRQGISRMLMETCVTFARDSQATEIFLITNDILGPAMGLYEQSGFIRQPSNNDTRYARGNTEMRLAL